jgi:hypothetical protein
MLKNAMDIAGFEGVRDEWWHYSVKNWLSYGPLSDPEWGRQQAAAVASPSPQQSALPAPSFRTGTVTPRDGGAPAGN